MPVRSLIPLLLLLSVAVRVDGEEYSRAGLLERPPFSAGKPGAAGAAPAGEFELRGFFGSAGSLEASIHKTGTNDSRWISVGATERGWTLESADIGSGTAVLLAGGTRLRLKLAESGRSPADPPVNADGEPVKNSRSQPYAVAVAAAGDARLARAKEEGLRRLRLEHPEYFKETNLMNDEERRISRNAFKEIDRQVAALAEQPAESP